jgi:hypothetical protein
VDGKLVTVESAAELRTELEHGGRSLEEVYLQYAESR